MRFRLASGAAALLFAVCAAVQYNDPDAAVWLLAYLAACSVSLLSVLGRAPRAASFVLAAVYFLWAASLVPSIARSGELTAEQGREAGGLLLACAWMLVTGFAAGRERLERR
jgi:hypothetical protein